MSSRMKTKPQVRRQRASSPNPKYISPAQVVFVGRDQYLDFLDAEYKEKALEAEGLHGHDLEEAMEHETGERTGKNLHQLVEEGSFGGGFNWTVTNTLLSSWVASIIVIAIFAIGTRKLKMVPGRLQNFCEIVVEGLLNFVEGVIGRERSRLLLPVIATIFLFVLFNAWIGLVPIYQSLGFKEDGLIKIHLLRPAGTDMNMPLALALISFFYVELLGLRILGFSYIGKFVRLGSLRRGLSGLVRFRPMEGLPGIFGLRLHRSIGSVQRTGSGNQLHLQVVRKHDRRGNPCACIGLPRPIHSYHWSIRTRAVGGAGTGPHIRRAYAGVRSGSYSSPHGRTLTGRIVTFK